MAGQWTVLRSGSRDAGGLEVPSLPLGPGTAAGPMRLAIGPQGEARLLLPLLAHERPAGIDAGGALTIAESSFLQNGRVHRFLDVTCLSDRLEPVFGEVVDEIVARVSKGIGCVDAARTTLDDFRALLAATPSDQVELSRVAGLVAELVILNRLLDLSPSAWRAWTGPAGDRHDFRAVGTSLEVKASMRVGSPIVTINGLAQMETPAGGSLHLAHFILEPVVGGLLNISRLGGRALAKADDPASLRNYLASIGCPEVDADAWNRGAFKIESEALYKVEADFPRITPSVFAGGHAPAGIGEVTYRIDLSVASAYKCPAEDIEELVRTLSLKA